MRKALLAAFLPLFVSLLALAVAAPRNAFAVSCRVGTTALGFGSYAPGSGAPASAVGSLDLSCSPGAAAINYSISIGTGSSGTYTPRKMTSGSNALIYQLYTDAGHTTIFGNGTGGSVSVSGSFSPKFDSQNTSIPVYGLLPGGQWIPPGLYSDSLAVTVSW